MKNNLLNEFFTYETKNNLFDIEFESFKIWEILRTYVFIEIEQIYNNLQPLFPQKNSSKKKHISFNVINSIRLLLIKKRDYVFLNNPRRVKQKNGEYYCIYTDLLIDLLKKNHTCTTFEDPYWALSKSSNISHFEPIKTEDICYLDFVEFIFKIKKIFYKTFNRNYKKLHAILNKLEQDIEKEFKCNLTDIFKVGEDKILYLVLTKKIYVKLIKRIKPKAILEFYDAFPSKVVINKIAKEQNIPIIEIQHGIVTKENPIFLKYSDLSRQYDCVPDYVLSYGEKLLNTEHMPIKKNNIYYVGNLFLKSKINEYKNNIAKKKNILFISQSNLGKYISESASKLADLLKKDNEYKIIYKMHPYEIGNNYECLKKSNIEIINNREKDIYYYQSISIAQVGIYSTGIYEGIAFGLKTFILDNKYGTKEIKGILKEDNQITYVTDIKEIAENIKNIKENQKNIDNKYWEKVDENKIIDIIDKITNNC